MGKKKIYKNSDEEFIKIVNDSFSISEALKKLGLVSQGANFRGFKMRCAELNISTAHFTGQAHLRGKKHNWGKKIPTEEIFVENSTYNIGHNIKKRLFENKLLEEKCSECGITHWCNQKLSLHLDHINGINTDNRIENLRLLCPNCHSLTPTYCGRNKGIGKTKKFIVSDSNDLNDIENNKLLKNKIIIEVIDNQKNNCKECNLELSNAQATVCRTCYNQHRLKYQNYKHPTKITWPPLDELLEMLKVSSYVQLGKKLNVSDNAVRKHIEREKKKLIT